MTSSLITVAVNTGPLSLACDGNGHLFVACNDNTIGEYTTSGVTLNASLISSGLDQPYGIALDENGHIFAANQRSGAISEYTTTGVTINATLITGLDEPLGLVVVPEPSTVCLIFLGSVCACIFRLRKYAA